MMVKHVNHHQYVPGRFPLSLHTNTQEVSKAVCFRLRVKTMSVFEMFLCAVIMEKSRYISDVSLISHIENVVAQLLW
jgi:hypothetical protein